MTRDVLASTKVVEAIAPITQATNTAIVGNIIDRASFDAVQFLIYAGTLTTAGATFTPSLEHGDNAALADTTAVTAKEMIGSVAAATFDGNSDDKVFRLGYAGSKRYVRLTITPASNAANATVGALAALMGGAFAAGSQASMP